MDFNALVSDLDKWLNSNIENTLKRELYNIKLAAVRDNNPKAKKEIFDRFSKELEFGTGGIRGVIGAGPNRLNNATIKRATEGFAVYLLKSIGVNNIDDYINKNGENEKKKSKFSRMLSGGFSRKKLTVIIAYDTRFKSKEFALAAKLVLEYFSIGVYMFERPTPTPVLSYAIREYGAIGGINITASHNPKTYNGFKVYDSDGTQFNDEAAKELSEEIKKVEFFKEYNNTFAKKYKINIKNTEVYKSFFKEIFTYADKQRMSLIKNLNVVYTPLNGAGLDCMNFLAKNAGLRGLHVPNSQRNADYNFPTTPIPNPELKNTFYESVMFAENLIRGGNNIDACFATDPDADRVRFTIRDKGMFKFLSGNELGLLLLDYLLKRVKGKEYRYIISTFVSSPLVKTICDANGFTLYETETGFKNIGSKMNSLSRSHKLSRVLFSFEESCGYLIGKYARDKDAFGATLLTLEMMAFYKSKGQTLIDVLEEIYDKYGLVKDKMLSFDFDAGSIGKVKTIMDALVSSRGSKVFDASQIKHFDESGAVRIFLNDGSQVYFRGSGTEPKLKAYLYVKGENKKEVLDKLNMFKKKIIDSLNTI